MPEELTPTQKIEVRRLNDRFRQTLTGGEVMLTAGMLALTEAERTEAVRAVVQFNDFTPDNDPHGEHDFGLVSVGSNRVFWKIDYYDLQHRYASPDPSDVRITRRVLTIMLSDEW